MKNRTSAPAGATRRAVQNLIGTFVIACLAGFADNANAQTTLSGDHVVEGNLNVGTSVTRGNLTVNGATGSLAQPAIRVDGDGGVIFGGTFGEGALPSAGFGVGFMWFPKKAALRFGNPAEWDEPEIGEFSTVLGKGTASGEASFATGMGETMGDYAFTAGRAYASGPYACGVSGGAALGDKATGMSGGYVEGDYATALSRGMAEGSWSTGMSRGYAVGDGAVAAGDGVIAWAYRSVVLGSYNRLEGNESEDTAVPTEPIFVVGCGTGNGEDPPEAQSRNAIVVRKNSDVEINGKIKIARQGDISMGEFAQ